MDLKEIFRDREMVRRIVMTVAGTMICGFSVGMFNHSRFGIDPFQVFAHGIWNHIPMGFGLFYTLLNLLMLLFVFLTDRRKIGLGTVINIFLLGYMVQFSSWLFATLFPNPLLSVRIALLASGLIVISLGASLYFTADLGVSTYDAMALMLADKKVAPFKYCRIGTDVFCVAVGFAFGATVGIGTIATAFFMGPVIAFFNRTVAVPLRYGKPAVL